MDLVRSYLNLYIMNPYQLIKDQRYVFHCREAHDPYGPQFMEVFGSFQHYYGPTDIQMSRFKNAVVIMPGGDTLKYPFFECETLFMFDTRELPNRQCYTCYEKYTGDMCPKCYSTMHWDLTVGEGRNATGIYMTK